MDEDKKRKLGHIGEVTAALLGGYVFLGTAMGMGASEELRPLREKFSHVVFAGGTLSCIPGDRYCDINYLGQLGKIVKRRDAELARRGCWLLGDWHVVERDDWNTEKGRRYDMRYETKTSAPVFCYNAIAIPMPKF